MMMMMMMWPPAANRIVYNTKKKSIGKKGNENRKSAEKWGKFCDRLQRGQRKRKSVRNRRENCKLFTA